MKSQLSWILRLLASAAAIVAVVSNQATALEFSSGSKQTKLIELYTSEGCSSCPPADRWLTKLKDDSRLWQDFVPVAFHVDYWDYIGWADRFAKPSHAARQRQHAKLGNVKTVYTPGFIINGAEWRGWFRGQDLPAQASDSGLLSAVLARNEITLTYEPIKTRQQIIATIVLLGAGHVSEVKRGENADKTLAHDFAVLSQQSISLDYLSGENLFRTTTDIEIPTDARAIAVWVAPRASLRPIQATGAWLTLASEVSR